MKKKTSAKMIKKAIDSYPGGICFSALDGRVILVNEKMNQLMLELTGHTILNAKVAWEELANFANNGKAEKTESVLVTDRSGQWKWKHPPTVVLPLLRQLGLAF